MTRRVELAGLAFMLCIVSFGSASRLFGAVPEPELDAPFIATVPVGNPGNAPDTTGYGAVDHYFRMGTTEVTNGQYVVFLNSVAKSDPYGLYTTDMTISPKGGIIRSGSSGNYSYSLKPPTPGNGLGGTDYAYENKPVIYVTWYDAIRFANWMHNGRGNGGTETGAYTLGELDSNGVPLNGRNIIRNQGARWFVPSENEWYKAAYHKNDGVTGNYWDYPTQSDTKPNNNLPFEDTGNSALLWDGSHPLPDINYSMLDVGLYPLTSGPYGTLDQAGNVWEWTEALHTTPIYRVLRGGSWAGGVADGSSALTRSFAGPSGGGTDSYGFRLASIPEPSTVALLVIGLATIACRRWRTKIN